MMKYVLAIDVGASGGRHILGHLENGKLMLEEVYRFDNGMTERDGHLCWRLDRLYEHILKGMAECKKLGKTPVSVGIDTWGVDYVLLDAAGNILGDTIAYRDSRTQGMDTKLEKTLPFEALYARVGIAKQPFNTLYQLLADKRDRPESLEKAERLLFMPEYLAYVLSGRMENEYTIASTSGLLDAQKRDWAWALIDFLGLPRRLFGPLRQPGFSLGRVRLEIAREIGFAPEVILPPAHDTAAAVLGAPLEAGDAFLSSGTWSLLGAEIDAPVLTRDARLKGLTNEGGVAGTYRFLKNIMGLWIIQNIRRELSGKPSFGDMAAWAEASEAFPGRIDVDAPEFLAPENMTEAIRAHLIAHGQPLPQTPGELLACVNHSLAESYAATLKNLEVLIGRPFKRLCIVGGGSQNQFLNRLTAQACGIPVTAGPTEGTALGNLLCQMLGSGEIPSIPDARALILDSFDIQRV